MLQNAHLGPYEGGDGMLQRRSSLLEVRRLFPKRLGHYAVAGQLIAVAFDKHHRIQRAAINLVQRPLDGAAGMITRHP